MKAVRFHDTARIELRHGVSYYTKVSPLLGRRLADAVEEAVTLARSFPDIGAPYFHHTKRVFPKRFPFSIVYLETPSESYVVALAPFHRKPGYWQARTTE